MFIYILLVSLIACSALFTALEIAFFSMDEIDFLTIVHSKHRYAKILIKLKNRKENLLFGLLSFNNASNIAASALNIFVVLDLAKVFNVDAELLAGLTTTGLLIIIIIFAEAIPKLIALKLKHKLCLMFAPFMMGVVYFTYPLSQVIGLVAKLLENIKFSLHKVNPSVFQEAFIGFTEQSTKKGLIGQNENEVIRNVLALNRPVSTIIKPRNQVFAVKNDSLVKDVISSLNNHSYSRFPIYSEDLDNIKGVVHIRDVFNAYNKNQHQQSLMNISTAPLFISDTWSIWNVMNILKRKNSHLGIVIDEFGGMRGIVTLEDIMEELVGNILDEKDIDESPEINQTGNDTWTAAGSVDIHSLKKILKLELPEEEYETLQGFIMHNLKKIPTVGDYIAFEDEFLWQFKVKQMVKNEIKSAEIVKINKNKNREISDNELSENGKSDDK